MNKLLRDLTDGERTTIRVLLSSRSRGVTAKGARIFLSYCRIRAVRWMPNIGMCRKVRWNCIRRG